VVLTFHPHPRLVLHGPDSNLRLLTTLEEKTELLSKAGIDHFIIHPFTREFSRTDVVHYVRDLLVGKIGMKQMVIGYDHHFGRNREGSLENLRELAPLYEFEIEEIPAQDIDNVNVSSTKIRKALNAGNVNLAAQYLGYSYRITGKVVQGNRIGRSMGFPTANILVENRYKMIPANGVYAVAVYHGRSRFKGMLNIGHRPTVNSSVDGVTIEVHIIGFEGDLYEEQLTVEFISRLRDEIRFEDTNQLKEQLMADREMVHHAFNSAAR
jgi:riboflavin kinase/FMN adenylyltransferase